jgi:hypothetical protein
MNENLLLAGVLGVRTHRKNNPVVITLLIVDMYVAWYYKFLALIYTTRTQARGAQIF